MLGQNSYAEEALKLASMARNQGAMTRTSAPEGPERMLSSGLTDKVEINEQPEKNANYTLQGQKQNLMSAVPQAQANAVRGVRKQQTDMSQQEYEAQRQLADYKAMVLLANDGGAATMQLGALANDPVQQKEFGRRIAEARLQSERNNPQNGYQSTNFYA